MSLSILSIGQEKRIKEKRVVHYTLLKDKDGNEKKKIKNYVDYVIRYDTLGREIENIQYGEVSHTYTKKSVGCSWNYENIKYVEKTYYSGQLKICDSTWYYKDNKPDYFSGGNEYSYQNKDNLLISIRQFDKNNTTKKNTNLSYDHSNQLIKKNEIENTQEYGKQITKTTTTLYQYDGKGRPTSEITTHSKLNGWKRTYDYLDDKNIKRKYFYSDINDQYPFSIHINEYNSNEVLERKWEISTESPSINSTDIYTYSEGNLYSIETEDFQSKDGIYELLIFEYVYY